MIESPSSTWISGKESPSSTNRPENTSKNASETVLVFACVQLLFEAIDLGLEPLLRNLALTLGALLAKLLQFVDLRTETGSCRSEAGRDQSRTPLSAEKTPHRAANIAAFSPSVRYAHALMLGTQTEKRHPAGCPSSWGGVT